MKTVLFACVHNAGRSQMSAALFNLLADPAKARAISAGTEPAPRVHPEVLEAMKELGVDLSGVVPQKLTGELAGSASLLVTMGCGEACPVVPGLRREDWPLEDPRGQPVERVRGIRDEIDRRVRELLAREGYAKAAEKSRRRGARRIVLLFVVAGLAMGSLKVYLFFSPADRVAVSVHGLPPNTRWLCLIAETATEPVALGWYRTKVYPFVVSPPGSTLGRFEKDPFVDWVQWRNGQRYGVLTRTLDREWKVWWFDVPDVPLRGRLWILGGGRVELQLTHGRRPETPRDAFIRRLGFTSEHLKHIPP